MAFEEYIKNKFENFSPRPPQSVWDNIQQHIHKPWYKQLWLKAMIAIMAVTFSGIIFTLNKIPNNNSPISAISIKTPKINITISKETQHITQQDHNPIQQRTKASKTDITSETTDSYITSNPQPETNTTKSENNFSEDSYYKEHNEHKKINFSVVITPKDGCAPLKIRMKVIPPENMNVSWFIDKNLISNSNNTEYILQEGSHFIQLVLFDQQQTILVYDTVVVFPKPKAQFDIENCQAGDTLLVKNLSINANTYKWNFGDGQIETSCTPLHIYANPGLYNITLIASNIHCSDTINKTISVKPKDAAIIFPNAFVPDISGPNGGYYNPNKHTTNIFHPIFKKPVKDYNLKIFDRRGKLIFETQNINQGWDGYYRNELVPVGVYIYIAQGSFEDGEKFTVKGDITVIYRR